MGESHSKRRRINEVDSGITSNNESDSNADTCCLGKNWIVCEYTTRSADVFPYDDSYEPTKNVPIVSGATAYTTEDHETFILVINEGLFYGDKLGHSLINPNQVRHNNVEYWDNPYDKDKPLAIIVPDVLTIPLQMQGTKIYFESRTPTQHELDTCMHVNLTSREEWNPHDISLSQTSVVSPLLHERFCSESKTFPSINDESELLPIIPHLFERTSHIQSASSASPTDVSPRQSFVSNERHTKITSERLAERFGIGPSRAKATLKATTQRGVRSAILPISRRYRADRFLGVRILQGKFATDTLWMPTRTIAGNIASQIYSHKCGFAAAYHLHKADGPTVGYTLNSLIHDYGKPGHLTFDGIPTQTGHNTLFMETIRRAAIPYHVSQPYTPRENPSEGSIREIKRRLYRIMHKNNIPWRLWDFIVSWVCETGCITVSSSPYAKGRTPIEILTGETPDITEYLDFGPYDWVTYKQNAGLDEPKIGRWLGISHRVGPLMSYWILPESGIPISCTTVQPLSFLDQDTTHIKTLMEQYNQKIHSKFETQPNVPKKDLQYMDPQHGLHNLDDDPDFFNEFSKVINDESIPEEDGAADDSFDPYIRMELSLPRGEDGAGVNAQVVERVKDEHDNPVGRANPNPLLDSRQYKVEFDDGSSEVLSANIIAENIIAQVDPEGHRQRLLSEITDHRKNEAAVKKEDGEFVTSRGLKQKKRTTKGWELYVEWKDGGGNWIALKDLKHSYPVELADYAVENNIQDEPAFAWWVPWTRKKRDRIISKIKSKYWERSHKYGIRIPKSVEEAKRLDAENKNTYWMDAVKKEMSNVRVAFEEYDGNPNELVGYQQIQCHMIFDIKLTENFRRKARYVAGGHKTKPPAAVTYSSVVSRDSVRVALLLAGLNGLDILSGDIQNAYLSAPNREKVYCKAGPEFGSDCGKIMIIVRALYGLKSAGAAFRAHLAATLDDMSFSPSHADPDVWLRPGTKADGEEYYEYVLVYVDDILAISVNPKKIMNDIQSKFKFKNNAIVEPEMYLGARLKKRKLGTYECWTMNSNDYIQAAIKNVEERLSRTGGKLVKRATTPMSSGYKPELEKSEELDAEDTQYFQELIGILRWATEIGRVDILTEVSLLSSYQASPRQGHMDEILHIFAYLKQKPKLSLYFDQMEPQIDSSIFNHNVEPFKEHYRDAKEDVPFNQPPPRGCSVVMTAYVDASHAANKVTRRSHTGYIIFVNRAPILWYSKRQTTVESSTFSSEFIALRTMVEAVRGLRFKLKMFGVPVDGPASVLCDNEKVVHNSSSLESTLDKKHSSIAYHATRWAVAAGIILVGWIPTNYNLADAMSKCLTAAQRDFLFGEWTY